MSLIVDDTATAMSAQPPVAPSILSRVANLGRPSVDVPLCGELDHLPGAKGLWAGLTNILGMQRNGVAHFVSQVKRYGPVYRYSVANKPAVFVADPGLIGAMTRNEDRSWSCALAYRVYFSGLDVAQDTLDSLVGLDFEAHRDARRLMLPAFSPNALAGYLATAGEMFEHAAEQWFTRGRASFKAEVRALFAKAASKIFMGERDAAELAMLDETLLAIWESPFAVAKNPLLSRKWRRGISATERLCTALRAQVEERRASDRTDLFSRMCQVGLDGVDWLDDDALVRVFISVMAGAFETTSLGISSMAYLLAKHPEWQERMRVESRLVNPGPLSYEGAKKLEQHEWCWKEALRLFPVVPAVPRIALRDVELGGHRIPAGTMVQSMTAAALWDPKWWKAPETFDPERFAPERAEDKQQRSAFLPFGSGAHTCIGMQLANLKVKALWHAILSKGHVRLGRDYIGKHQFNPFGSVAGPVDLVFERIR